MLLIFISNNNYEHNSASNVKVIIRNFLGKFSWEFNKFKLISNEFFLETDIGKYVDYND